ncbi:biopolymer transporter ExbD [Komagataeibacter xylinus]|uniref:ExbD/TolR family protein n=1 Tax=Komagataeibacter xylinus TaxID=28448 RepID=UPI00280AE04B|nr:biopolymer transporter ExbD [Komagataeibacter xylinus]
MGMQVGGGGDEDEVVSAINTTPLVDVMLVLLIIFLITIPVATHTIKVSLPMDANQPTRTLQNNIVVAITPTGQAYWNETPLTSYADLESHLEHAAAETPQPQIQIRGDQTAKYEGVGKVIAACQQAGIVHVDFITEQPHG